MNANKNLLTSGGQIFAISLFFFLFLLLFIQSPEKDPAGQAAEGQALAPAAQDVARPVDVQVHSGKTDRQGEEDAEGNQPVFQRLLFDQDDDQGNQNQG